jgi:hypothetical protein
MSELQTPPQILPVITRSDNFIISPSVTNAVASLNATVGTAGLAAFTGAAANERFTLTFKALAPVELMVNLSAATTNISLYFNDVLVQTTAAATGFQSLGTIAVGTNYYLQVTSSIAIAAAALAFQMSCRRTFTFSSYFPSNTPSYNITGMTYSVSATGCPIYTFNNSTLIANAAGYCPIDSYYAAKGSGFLTFTTGGSLFTYFPVVANQTFTLNDNIAVALQFPVGVTQITNVTGTLIVNIPGLGTPTYVPMASTSYTGQNAPNMPYFSGYNTNYGGRSRANSERMAQDMESEDEEIKPELLSIEPAKDSIMKKTIFNHSIKY